MKDLNSIFTFVEKQKNTAQDTLETQRRVIKVLRKDQERLRPAAGTTYFADPAEELLAVCLTQVLQQGMMPNNNYQETFQRLAYQALN